MNPQAEKWNDTEALWIGLERWTPPARWSPSCSFFMEDHQIDQLVYQLCRFT